MQKITFRPLKEGDAQEVKQLLFQLTDNIGENMNFRDLVEDPRCHCVVGEFEGKLVAFGALVRHTVPTKGEVARVEDVIVDEKMRGKGFGKALMQELIDIAKEEEVVQINLTSSPLRVAAQELYKSLGFIKGSTDVFMLKL